MSEQGRMCLPDGRISIFLSAKIQISRATTDEMRDPESRGFELGIHGEEGEATLVRSLSLRQLRLCLQKRKFLQKFTTHDFGTSST